MLSWLAAVVPSCLKEWRNIDGNLGRKCFFKKREYVNVSTFRCLSLFSGQQQDQGFDDKNRFSLLCSCIPTRALLKKADLQS